MVGGPDVGLMMDRCFLQYIYYEAEEYVNYGQTSTHQRLRINLLGNSNVILFNSPMYLWL